jgi:lipopolysaccharide transport system ATP-binding protein
MMVRLGFSTALRADADTLLLDEVLAVGDAQFQRKCIDVFQGLKRQRKTIVLVSHDLASVQRFCEHVYWLDKGRVAFAGEATDVIQTYLAVNQAAYVDQLSGEGAASTEHRWGDGQVRFTEVALTDEHGRSVTQVTPWTPLVLHATVVANAAVESPVFGMLVWFSGQLVYSVNTRVLGMEIAPFRAGERRRLDIQFTPALANGLYKIAIAVAAETDGGVYDWLNHAASFLVAGARCGDGICDLRAELVFDGGPPEARAAPSGGTRG